MGIIGDAVPPCPSRGVGVRMPVGLPCEGEGEAVGKGVMLLKEESEREVEKEGEVAGEALVEIEGVGSALELAERDVPGDCEAEGEAVPLAL